jgi:hypothetical protein
MGKRELAVEGHGYVYLCGLAFFSLGKDRLVTPMGKEDISKASITSPYGLVFTFIQAYIVCE